VDAVRAAVVVCTGLLLLSGCSETELPQQQLRSDDCLRVLQLDALPAALQRCDQVVARFPRNPGPRNDRSLLLALSGDDAAACREIAAAQTLAARAPAGSLDPLVRQQLKLRNDSCLITR